MTVKKALKTAAVLTGAAALTTAAGAWCGYRTAFQADPRRQSPIQEIPKGEGFDDYRDQMLDNIRILLETPYERVTVRSHDGLKLVGKFYEGKPGAPLILFFHGYRSTAERDGSGGFQLCREQGWHILMPDQRAHGESEGDTITFGVRERLDCLAWARYAAKRMGPDTPVFLWGISMGAATVLMAADLDQFPVTSIFRSHNGQPGTLGLYQVQRQAFPQAGSHIDVCNGQNLPHITSPSQKAHIGCNAQVLCFLLQISVPVIRPGQ